MSPPFPLPDPQSTNPFFDQVVATSGLASLIASAAVVRACQRARVDPHRLDPPSLGRVLPHLEATLRLYVPDEADKRIRALQALAR